MKVKTAILIMSVLVFITGCASTVGTVQDSTLKEVKDIDLYHSFETQSFLTVSPHIFIQKIDNSKYYSQITSWGEHVIPSGYHSLSIQYGEGIYDSNLVSISHMFESGKSYKLQYNITKEVGWGQKGEVAFFIVENIQNDTEIDNYHTLIKNYLAFSEKNPLYLEGTWTYSIKHNLVYFTDVEITFDGNNRFTATSFERVAKKNTLVITKGRYYFNDNTIILYCEKQQNIATQTGQEQEEVFWKEILHYKMEGGTLNIKSGGSFLLPLPHFKSGNIKGNYTKK
jgi:hypothetical protein